MTRAAGRLVLAVVRRVPWWAWVLAVVVGTTVADGRRSAPSATIVGIGGAVLIIGALVHVVTRRSSVVADWQQVEREAAAWLRSIGCRDVRLTSAGADGGVDILTREWAVQVKHRSSRTGRPAVQQIVGAALAVDRAPAVVSTSGFTAPAIEFADQHQVALVELDDRGRGHRVNPPARRLGTRRARFLR